MGLGSPWALGPHPEDPYIRVVGNVWSRARSGTVWRDPVSDAGNEMFRRRNEMDVIGPVWLGFVE